MKTKIEPTGVVIVGVCTIKTNKCVASTRPEPITAVYQLPERVQMNVCGACLAEMVGSGKWESGTPLILRRFDPPPTPDL